MKKYRLLTRYISQNGKIYEPHEVIECGELPSDVESYLIATNRMIQVLEPSPVATAEVAVEREPNKQPATVKRKPGRPRKYETREMRA